MSNLIPENDYRVTVKKWELGETKNENVFARVTVEITEEGEYKGSRLHKDLFFTEKGWESSVKMLRSIGWTGADVSDLSEIIDKQTTASVKQVIQTDYNNNTRTNSSGEPLYRNEIAWLGNSGPKPLEPNKQKAFAEAMKAKILLMEGVSIPKATPTPAQSTPTQTVAEKIRSQNAAKAAKKAAPQPPPQPEQPAAKDDDVPF